MSVMERVWQLLIRGLDPWAPKKPMWRAQAPDRMRALHEKHPR
jgi:hypothetical protein